MALVAEQEREQISRRTKEALAAAKARGRQLGAYRDGVFVGRKGTAQDALMASKARQERATASALEKAQVLREFDPDGSLSLRELAQRLNAAGVPTPTGKGEWQANTVRRARRRINAAKQ